MATYLLIDALVESEAQAIYKHAETTPDEQLDAAKCILQNFAERFPEQFQAVAA